MGSDSSRDSESQSSILGVFGVFNRLFCLTKSTGDSIKGVLGVLSKLLCLTEFTGDSIRGVFGVFNKLLCLTKFTGDSIKGLLSIIALSSIPKSTSAFLVSTTATLFLPRSVHGLVEEALLYLS
jgi:hypothetical protein